MFIAFCANYAGIPKSYFPTDAHVESLAKKMTSAQAYMVDLEYYTPKKGDLVFFKDTASKALKHVGLVEKVAVSTLYTIEGNATPTVCRREYQLTDESIYAYASIDTLIRKYREDHPDAAVTETPEITPDESGLYPCQAVTVKDAVNIRAGADSQSMLVLQIEKMGTEVTVLGEETVEDTLWYGVSYNGYTGFIRADLIELIAAEEPAEEEETVTLESMRAEVAAYIEALGITPDMPDEYLLYAYGNHESYEAAQASLTKQDEMAEKAKQLSEEEQLLLYNDINSQLCIRYRTVAENAYAVMVEAEYTVNSVKFATNTGTLSESGGTVTASISGKDGSCGGSGTAATMELTITNTSDAAGSVSFDMVQTSVNKIVAGSEDLAGKTNYSKSLEAGGSFTITITTGANSTVNKVVFSNITFTDANQAFTVTVEYPTANGSVTSSVTGETVEADGVATITIPDVTATDGVTLTATSDSFLCWVDKDNKLLSYDAAYTVNPSADITVKAVMTGGNAYFMVDPTGNKLVYGDLNTAVSMASTASNKTVVLMNDGTLPAGEYTIPSGMTLLVPFDAANTVQTTKPATTDVTSIVTPTAYRTLTMAEGANLTVEGALSIPSTQHSGSGMSSPHGPTAFVNMESGSSITVPNGGKLYVWGYITGKGSVTIQNGGTVYECFQVMDWRGGDNTSGMIDNSKRVFPFSQYYVQNVEVPMTLEAGAVENGYMSIVVTLAGIQDSAVPFIGSSGLFNIDSGKIIKDYNENNGRLEIDVYGTLSIKSLSLSMKLSLLGTKTVNSKNYVLPLNGNMTIRMHSGKVNMTQDVLL